MLKNFLRKNILMIFILVSALIVRVIGLNPGYPPFHPDEPMSYGSAIIMTVKGNIDPGRYDYPAGVPLVHWFFYRIFLLPVALFRLFFLHPRVFLTALRIGNRFLEEFKGIIFGPGEYEALFFSRYITAVFGVSTVFLTYLLTKRVFNKNTGLIAAFFLAFNWRHVLSSHLALPDAVNGFFGILAVYVSYSLFLKNTLRNYLLSGLTCGLYLSMKYQFFPIVTFLFVQAIWVFRKRSLKEFINKNFLLAIILIPIVFIALNPYFFLNLTKAITILKYVSGRYFMGIKKFSFYSFFYLYHWGIGKLPFLAIIGGLLLGLVLEPLKTLFLLSYIFPIFFVFTYYSWGGIYTRNFTNVMPFILIFAGFFFSKIWQLIKKISWLPSFLKMLVFFILVAWVNLASIKNSTALSYFYTKRWNFTQLSIWIAKNLPFGVKVASHPGASFPPERETIRTDYPLSKKGTLAEIQEAGDQFAILNLDVYHSSLYGWSNYPPRNLIQYDGVPYEILANTFPGLAIEELLNYSVAEFFTPWQAPNINYLVFKIPASLNTPEEKIISFDFSKNEDNWPVKDTFGTEAKGFIWDENEGHFGRGSLKIKEGMGGFSTTRFSSPPIQIQPAKYYVLSGWIKNSKNPGNISKDGFLRLDFYENIVDAQAGQNRLGVAISARVLENDSWIKKQATAISPQKANYITLSFQRESFSSGFDSNLDDVALLESDIAPEENFPNVPYIKPKISETELYPNSII